MNDGLENLAMLEFLSWTEKRSDLRILPVMNILNNNKERNNYDTLNRIRDYCGFDDLYNDNEIKPDYGETVKGHYTRGW